MYLFKTAPTVGAHATTLSNQAAERRIKQFLWAILILFDVYEVAVWPALASSCRTSIERYLVLTVKQG